jgi:hypothetical protein
LKERLILRAGPSVESKSGAWSLREWISGLL